ncbi:MAG TPA: hypothetical protein DHN33_08585 [Eubacteriaceae bacterium]|nr:hypothetical protein [Eubacteriaceae bacterium]
MEVYIARQPIFDRRHKVVAYELLYREDPQSNFHNDLMDDHVATSRVLINSFLNLGLENITEGKKAFVNFGEKTLTEDISVYFTPSVLTVEILENVKITENILNACVELKKKGYQIAIDDFEEQNEVQYEKILPYIDILKVDLFANPKESWRAIAKNYRGKGIKLLAEKVETEEVYNQVRDMGYDYFQGYFFSKPKIVAAKNLTSYEMKCFDILRELNEQEPDYDRLAELVEQDVNLSYKFLKITNSPIFYLKMPIASIRQALVYLGIKEIRRFISMLLVYEIKGNKPDELIKKALVRGKLCELIGQLTASSRRTSELFLLGLFSLIDAMLEQSKENLVKELPLEQDVKECLLEKETPANKEIYHIYKSVISFDDEHWSVFDQHIKEIDIQPTTFNEMHVQSIAWAKEALNINME